MDLGIGMRVSAWEQADLCDVCVPLYSVHVHLFIFNLYLTL